MSLMKKTTLSKPSITDFITNPHAEERSSGFSNLNVERYDFELSGPGTAWATASVDVDPPAGYRCAYASVAGFDIYYTNGDQKVWQIGAYAGVERIGGSNKLRITAYANLRDNDGKEYFKATILVNVMYCS